MKTITIKSNCNNKSINLRVEPIALDTESSFLLGLSHYATLTANQCQRVERELYSPAEYNPTNQDRLTGKTISAEVYFNL